MFARIKTEPAVVTSALVAIVGVAATLGIIGTDQQAQIVAVITAVVPLVGGLIVRASVTPTAKFAVKTLAVSAAESAASVEPESVAPVAEDPVKLALKSAIENVRATSNNTNDARAAAATAAVDASA